MCICVYSNASSPLKEKKTHFILDKLYFTLICSLLYIMSINCPVCYLDVETIELILSSSPSGGPRSQCWRSWSWCCRGGTGPPGSLEIVILTNINILLVCFLTHPWGRAAWRGGDSRGPGARGRGTGRGRPQWAWAGDTRTRRTGPGWRTENRTEILNIRPEVTPSPPHSPGASWCWIYLLCWGQETDWPLTPRAAYL